MTTVEIVGPLNRRVLVINGRRVPYLEASLRPGGVVTLRLDDRLVLDVAVADFDRVAKFVADCIAVASGYTSHPRPEAEPVPRSLFPRWTAL
jgi:hypothetical protein